MELLRYIAALGGISGQWNSCGHIALGSGQWNSGGTAPQCLAVVGTGTRAVHFRTAWHHWVVELLWYTATLPWHSEQWNSCGDSALGLWALELLRYTAALCGRKGQWNSHVALPHYLGEVGSGTLAVRLSWGSGQWNSGCTPLQCLGVVGYPAQVRFSVVEVGGGGRG